MLNVSPNNIVTTLGQRLSSLYPNVILQNHAINNDGKYVTRPYCANIFTIFTVLRLVSRRAARRRNPHRRASHYLACPLRL